MFNELTGKLYLKKIVIISCKVSKYKFKTWEENCQQVLLEITIDNIVTYQSPQI